MNKTFAFNNAEEFNEFFGMRETQNGEKVRKNKILLRFLQDKNMHIFLRDKMQFSADKFFKLTDLSRLSSLCKDYGLEPGCDMKIMDMYLYSNLYTTDRLNGLCKDGDIKCIRYINKESGRPFKMKAGKMYKHLLSMTEFGRNLPESTILYLCEDFARQWEDYASESMPQSDSFELHVDDNFEDIYSREACGGRYFHSCMTDENQWEFYRYSVDAKAAYLTDEHGDIVSRCIVFPKVHECGSDTIWRLAERQYAPEGYPEYNQDLMKQKLVTALIKGGYIDGYKKVGASYDQPHSFVANNGDSLSDKDFWIKCCLEPGDTLSYQDTFKFYDPDSCRAYNEKGYGDDEDLGICDREYRGDEQEWDEYHERYCHETTTVYYHGERMECDSDNLEDFVYVGSGYYHEDDVHTCDRCGESYVYEDGEYFSELTEEYYCCEDCMEEAEKEWHEDNGEVQDYWTDEWIDKGSAVKVISGVGRYNYYHTLKEIADEMVKNGELVEVHGCYCTPRFAPQDYSKLGGWGEIPNIDIATIEVVAV